jgi:flavin reductase (DIM6/NTAB) family NADH-FMN oxidoreductase RutF
MEPKIIMVAVYHNTQTWYNLTTSKRALLQLLSEELAPVVRICGHLSGARVDKITRLQKRHQIDYLHSLPYFANAAGYLELQVERLISFGGDHDLAICSVLSSKNLADAKLLTTDYLRAEGLLR